MAMIGPFVRLMRPGDWVKNVFIFPALVFSELLTEPYWLGRVVVAFIAFCLLASGVYALNDVADVDKDRLHPVKRRRPVAAGEIAPHVAATFGAILLVAGLAVGLAVNVNVLVALAAYGMLQMLYNVVLKEIMFVDVVAISLGFALRAAAGAAAIEVQISPWLLLCVFFLCLYLGFIKRLCDIASAEAAGDGTWTPPAGYGNRLELNWLLCISATLCVVTYLMYALSEHTYELFGSRSIGFSLMTPLVLIAVHRFYYRASMGISDSPLAALRHDRIVLVAVLLFAAGTIAVLYAPGAGTFLEEIFFLRADESAP